MKAGRAKIHSVLLIRYDNLDTAKNKLRSKFPAVAAAVSTAASLTESIFRE